MYVHLEGLGMLNDGKLAPQQSSAMTMSQPKRKKLKYLTIQLPETMGKFYRDCAENESIAS